MPARGIRWGVRKRSISRYSGATCALSRLPSVTVTTCRPCRHLPMPDMTASVIAYVSHLLAGAVVFSGFFFVYLRLTPYDEFKLIREGNIAASLSLAGALLGFVLTIASSIAHADGLLPFVFWAVMASVVQLIVFLVLTRLMPDYRLQIEHNNIAAGMLFGVSALAVGVINAACLS